MPSDKYYTFSCKFTPISIMEFAKSETDRRNIIHP